jgi:uncharacterized protein GlcG (DUF336 family)
MPWLDFLFGGRPRPQRPNVCRPQQPAPLALERLESRVLLDASAVLAGGVLNVLGGPGNDRINLRLDAAPAQLVLLDGGREVGRFASAAVTQVNIDAGSGNNVVRIANDVLQPATISGGPGVNVFYAGGGPTTLVGGDGANKLVAGPGQGILVGGSGLNHLFGGAGSDFFVSGSGSNLLYNVKDSDVASAGPNDQIVRAVSPVPVDPTDGTTVLDPTTVSCLLQRAAAASASNDAIIAIVDRGGNILGVRVEGGVSPNILSNPSTFTFAVDGAVAEARTGAFFANNQAPLTSRTVQFISQSTITQREVNSTPDIPDPNSTLRGPGFVAPVGDGGHFPPGVMFTPQVDLFAIEHTNRDSLVLPGPDGIRGTTDDIVLPSRFNVPTAFIPPGQGLSVPESYGFNAYPATVPAHFAQSRGIGTLPGGIPIFEDNVLVGGIGVFFPGQTGFATEENSSLSATFDPTRPDRSLEAEYMAFAAVGGAGTIGTLAGVPPCPGISLPTGRIDLVGITLDIFGPGGRMGIQNLLAFGSTLGVGNPNSGFNAPIGINPTTGQPVYLATGQTVPQGWLVTPHAGSEPFGLSAADVTQIINQGINQANLTRAAIRLPLGSRTRMVFAVTDTHGNVLGLYRMPDATVFSIDVAVAKARNVAYYANPAELQPIDQVPGVPAGAALTNRTFRYLAEPRFPEGIDGAPPGPFSTLNDGGSNPLNGLQIGPPLPASAFQSALGHDAFNPDTNFHDPFDPANQNGVVFFPGSMPLYRTDSQGNRVLVGGLGVSGDGVDQDDVVTFAAAQGFMPPDMLRADMFFFDGVRLPFQKFNRNPEG